MARWTRGSPRAMASATLNGTPPFRGQPVTVFIKATEGILGIEEHEPTSWAQDALVA